MKLSRILPIFTLVVMGNVAAGTDTLQFCVWGVAFHPKSDALRRSGARFPRKLDENGRFVWIPGLAVGYDFRDKLNGSSWSICTFAGVVKECHDFSVYMVGVGPKYRHYFTPKFSGDFELYCTLVHINSLEKDEPFVRLLPAPSVGLNYHFDNFSTGLKVTFGSAVVAIGFLTMV